jgi:hypothetical protein
MFVPIINCLGEADELNITKGNAICIYCNHHGQEIFNRVVMAIRNGKCKKTAVVSVYLSEKYGDQRVITRENTLTRLLKNEPQVALWVWTYAERQEDR